MARALTAGMQSAINAQNMRPFFLMEAHFDSGHLYLWSGGGTLQYNGKSYIGTGSILSISPIKETKQMEANGIKITLSGLDQSIIQIAQNENYQDRPAYIYFGAFDTNWQIILDPYLQYEGRMDVMPINKGSGEQTTKVSMTVENILVDLSNPVVWLQTPEDQAIYFPGDTGFDRVASLQNKDIKLGAG